VAGAKEIRQRTRVVRNFPSEAAHLRLVTSLKRSSVFDDIMCWWCAPSVAGIWHVTTGKRSASKSDGQPGRPVRAEQNQYTPLVK
jgi:hypothetical protein